MDASVATRRAMTVLGLWAFAVVQPALDVLQRYPQFLTAHQVSVWDLTLALGLLCVAIPLALALLLQALHRWHARLGSIATGFVVALLLAATIAPPVLRRLETPTQALAWFLVLGIAIASAAWILRRPTTWRLLAVSALALPVFLVAFLVRGPLTSLAPALPPLGPGAERPVPVVILVFDALPLSSVLDPDGGIDRHQAPHFARLATDSLWLRNATTSADRTVVSIPALLTGRPPTHGLATFARHPENLFRLLSKSHDVVALEHTTQLCPPDLNGFGGSTRRPRVAALLSDLGWIQLHTLVPTRWRGRFPVVDATWSHFGPAPHSPAWDDWLQAIRPGPRPGLFYAHLPVPHRPYLYLPDGTRYSEHGMQWGGRLHDERARSRDEWTASQAYQRHLLQVRLADRRLGELVDRLQETGLWDDALVVVTSDHGISFRPGLPPRAVTRANAADILPVPLFLKLPGGERANDVSDRNVELIDLVATLARVLEFPAPPGVWGPSMLDTSAPPRPQKVCLTGWRAPREWSTDADLTVGVRATVARRVAAFGTGPDLDAVYRLGDRWQLVGQAVDSLRVGTTDRIRCTVAGRDRWSDVDPTTGFLPAEIVGTVAPRRSDLFLAIAINGRIEAVTRPGRQWPEARSAPWSAMVRPESLRPGANEVDAYVLEVDAEAVTLLAPTAGRGDALLHVRLGRAPVPGVREGGFTAAPRSPRYRWAGRHAWIELATPQPVPTALEVELIGADPTPVRIAVDGQELFADEIPRGPWSRRFPLPPLGDRMRVDLYAARPLGPEAPALRQREQIGVRGLRLRP